MCFTINLLTYLLINSSCCSINSVKAVKAKHNHTLTYSGTAASNQVNINETQCHLSVAGNLVMTMRQRCRHFVTSQVATGSNTHAVLTYTLLVVSLLALWLHLPIYLHLNAGWLGVRNSKNGKLPTKISANYTSMIQFCNTWTNKNEP